MVGLHQLGIHLCYVELSIDDRLVVGFVLLNVLELQECLLYDGIVLDCLQPALVHIIDLALRREFPLYGKIKTGLHVENLIHYLGKLDQDLLPSILIGFGVEFFENRLH